MNKLEKISKKKVEIINAMYHSKNGLSANELLEQLNELVKVCLHCEQPLKFDQIVKKNTESREQDIYSLSELEKAAEIYSDQIGNLYYRLFAKPLKELKPLQDLWRKENSPERFCIPDATIFYKWIRVKILGS